MNFASYEYLPFLALVVAAFQFVPRRAQAVFLVAASYAFYAWWSWFHLALLVLSSVFNYAVGLAIGASSSAGRRRGMMWLAVAANLALLGTLKYGAFLGDTWDGLAARAGWPELDWPELALPLGISFYTFQTLSYVIDVRRGRIEACKSFVDFALYVAFFPQLIAGPIERANHLLPQLADLRTLTRSNLALGLRAILWGLLKKSVVADRLAPLGAGVFADPAAAGPLQLWISALLMLAVLYLDFSAYTDIARGSARLFGVELVPNFERTFLVRTTADFWRRWHMSLNTWIADYVHAPLMKGRLSYARVWRANLISMGLFGLWHGAAWKFVALGLCVGAAVSINHTRRLAQVRRRAPARAASFPRRLSSWLVTILGASLCMVFFFSPDLSTALVYLRGLVPTEWPQAVAPDRDLLYQAGLLVVLFGVHATALLDLERAWQRIGPFGRLLLLAAAAAVLLRFRVQAVEPFVYFAF